MFKEGMRIEAKHVKKLVHFVPSEFSCVNCLTIVWVLICQLLSNSAKIEQDTVYRK